MTTRELVGRLLRGGAMLTIVLLSACATPQTHPVTQAASVAAPTPCGDSSYIRLRQQNPDSLSERAWQRLQTLDRECTAARTLVSAHTSRPDGHHMMGAGIVATVIMVAMMISMW
jgi:hypothetical protein